MSEDTYFNPRKVTDPNDRLDEDANLCIRGLFKHTQVVAHKVECHDKYPNIDGYIELVDDKDYPVGKLIVQAKTYKSKYKGKNKAEIPAYFVAYAMRMRNEICIFFSVDADENKIYWKYISDDYVRLFQKEGDNTIHIYEFAMMR